MKLYSLPMSPYAARVRLAVRARGLPVEIVAPPTDWRESAAWRAISPLGRVPALSLDDGSAIVESMVILEYLEDAYPEARPLRPAAPEAAARVRLVAAVAANEAQPALQQVLYALSPATGLDPVRGPAALETLGAALDALERVLVAAPFAAGAELSLADCCLVPLRFTVARLGPMIGQDYLAGHPKLARYEETIQVDPHMRALWQELDAALVGFLETWRQGS